jgi:YesN/AraC family two-component response regulator
MFQKACKFRVISEVADGLEAVQKAEELKPDLILLDIGLPKLNGMEAARQIRRLSPESKILFLSQESDPEVVRHALRIGAHGYVLKTHAGAELLDAMEAVARGEHFLSSGLAEPQIVQSPGRNTTSRRPLQIRRKKSIITKISDGTGSGAMEEHQDGTEGQELEKSPGSSITHWLVIAAGIAIVAAGLAVGYGVHQQTLMRDMKGQQEQMRATVGQLQGQIDLLTGKLNKVSRAQKAVTAAAAQANSPAAKQASNKRSSAEDKRLTEIQTRMDEQQKQLKDTQDQIAKTRLDLEENLSATRDVLSGSIARTHEELVALQKRGERNYVEFSLSKSKNFQRSGPLMLSLRKVDTRHNSFDLTMIVDDNEVSKTKVNLYEPIWIHRVDDPQPVQVVVNRIDKDHVRGYVSAAKYRNSELAPSRTPAS